ncbi:YoaK family protein [Dongia rigui]|uniref:YoaK family protein n=1 Tax=Dongia rigui TaxID=940149 RepID=A0ABU5DWX4_9PROT|nr:YoaK family protein [Dongia rigui]MDY0871492.1 YoaK family protein [Dongia rigui]
MSPYLAPLRAFTAGFVDTVGFVALFGLFTAHVTGNFVLIGASIAEFHGGIIAKLIALPVFILVVALTHLYVTHRQRRDANPIAALTLFEAFFLAAFMAAGLAAGPFTNSDSPVAIATGMLAVTAMAIQNAGARTVFANLSPTTVMTGNVTQIVIDVVDLIATPAKAPEAKTRLRKMLPPVLAFASGALAGGLGYVHVGFWALLLPLVAVMTTWLILRSAVRRPA